MIHDPLQVDLHLHSRHSKRPSEWFLRKIGCAESYTDPLKLYGIARRRGMDYVTLCDHNTIDGALEIAHLENTFISEEITTYFPEDGCKLHVLAWGITQQQHDDIQLLRESIYELTNYLVHEQVAHAVAHPMFAVNDRLTVDHFEKIVLLFKCFEMNGSRDAWQNGILRTILEGLTPETIARLATRHDIAPLDKQPHVKHIVAGSDDHSSLNIARIYTRVDTDGKRDATSLVEAIRGGHTEVGGESSNPKTMAHNLYSIAWQFYKEKFKLNRLVGTAVLLRFADRALLPDTPAETGLKHRIRDLIGFGRRRLFSRGNGSTMAGLLTGASRDIIVDDPKLSRVLTAPELHPRDSERLWFRFVNKVSERSMKHFIDPIIDSLSGANLFDIFQSVGSVGSLYTLLAPYFIAYGLFTKDRDFCRRCASRFNRGRSEKPSTLKMAHFTDTFYEVNGVATTLQMNLGMARKLGKDVTILTCGPDKLNQPGVVNFPAVGTFGMPEYPGLKLYYPPVLGMLEYCYDNGITHLHSATPGPIGLACLGIARILKLPVYGTYHTALPQYVAQLTEDGAMEELMWRYMVWYYNQLDAVYTPSRTIGDELIQRGIEPEKIRHVSRGIDIQRFHPSRRNGYFTGGHGVTDDEVLMVYVGRVSREKNLPDLVEAFRRVAVRRMKVRLVVIGEGPYLDEMKEQLTGLPVTYTGWLEGEGLADAYASCDVLVFPSTTDTLGNVVLEAQASGLAVIVTDRGGPRENMIDGQTGLVVPGGDIDELTEAILRLAGHRDLLEQMKANARRYMQDRSLETSWMKLWESYHHPTDRAASG